MTLSPAPRFSGVVVAAGRSTRFGPGVPKPFRDLAGRTVLQRSVDSLRAHPSVAEIVVVLPPDLCDSPDGIDGAARLVRGGESRTESVLAGVRAASHDLVLVHDAARPRATRRVVDAVVSATVRHGAAIPLLRVVDTVKRLSGDGTVRETVDRERLGLAQTPQGARRDWLIPALQSAIREKSGTTDEASALERAGRPVMCVDGDPDNEKITTLEDLDRMRQALERVGPEFRVGNGFDVHRFDADRPLVLGGLEFPGEPGLAGHSDADAVLHAAMDAILGAAAMGDIGTRYPPGDPRYAGADSAELAADVAAAVRHAGFVIVNVDVTILAERPRIGPRMVEMRERIAACLGIGADRVGVKATTLERLGALGRVEGVGCQATATLARSGR